MARSEYHGKRGANAGDDYHELWAVRRALELIVPGSDLIALTVEGVSPEDAVGVDDAQWDGVDVACYHGPDTDTIEAVVLIQLKYSGSEPNKAWTVSRLAYASNKGKTNALINRLAAAWKSAREKRPELDAADNISVKLASNQPVAQEVLDAMSAVPGDPDLESLRAASGLGQADFAAFALAMDFSECGDTSRFAHEERVIVALSALKDGDVRSEFTQLREYVRKRMRPEGSGELITAESIFGLFGHADRRAFFPHQSRIAAVALAQLIPREAAGRIRDRFIEGALKLCLVGAGGEGKTTALQDLDRRLPKGSELIVYDCYGEGSYLNANGYRHRAEDAFLQLGNDVAARFLLPPMFAERGVDHPRRFAAKLCAAADALAARSPDALLVIAIDAADNAVTAARQCVPPEPAFVHAFARLGELPANVRLLLSARMGRLAELDLPTDVEQVPLGPFEDGESRSFVEARLGLQSDAWHEEFHTHSGGNPRVQRYAMDFAGDVPARSLDYLKPNGKDLAAIFNARMVEARMRSGAPTDLAQLCAALILLPRPVPINHLAGVISATDAHARDLVLDLAPGLVIDDDQVGFADEDFEHFVREAGQSAARQVIETAADRLMAMRAVDPYACAHVANLSLVAERREAVIALVREPVREYPLADPGARGEIHRRRLRAAMHVCRETGNTIDAAALLLEGAHAIKTDEAVHRTLLDHVELASNFSRDAVIALLLRDRDRRPQHGTLLLHLAGVDGVQGDRVGLNTHFRSFLAWQEARQGAFEEERLRHAATPAGDDGDEDWDDGDADAPPAPRRAGRHRRSTVSEGWKSEQARRWSLSPDDVAALTVGRLHAAGVDEAAEMLARPRPARFRYAVLTRLVRRLVRRGDLALLASLADRLPRRHPGRDVIAVALGIAGEAIDAERMLGRLERAATSGAFGRNRGSSDHMEDDADGEAARLLIDACDLVAINGGNRVRLRMVLEHAMPASARTLEAIGGYAPRATDVAARAFALSRVLAGELVKLDGFVVQSPATKPRAPKQGSGRTALRKTDRSERQAQEREKAKQLFGPILDLHAVRAKILIGEIAPADAPTELAAVLAKLGGERRYHSRQDDWRPRDDEAVRALMPVGAVPGVDAAPIFILISKALGPIGSLMRFGTIALLERASVVPGFRTQIVTLAVLSCEDARSIKIPAEEKISYLIGLAHLLLPINLDASNYCFDAAIGVAGDVDYDTLHAIAITADLSRRAVLSDTLQDTATVAGVLTAVVQDAAQRMGDSDGFPWDAVAVALATLSPAVALAACARFAELDLVRGRRFLADVIEQLAADRALAEPVLAAFLPVLGSAAGPLRELLLSRVAPDDVGLADEVARHALTEPAGDRRKLARAADTIATPGGWTRAFVSIATFIETRSMDERGDRHGDWSAGHASLARRPVDPRLLDPVGIDGVASFLSRIEAIVAAEAAMYPSRPNVAERLLSAVPLHRIGAFLDIIAAIPEGDDVVRDLTRVLLDQFERWGGQRAAVSWANERLLEVVMARLPEVAWNIGYRADDLVKLLDLTGASDSAIASRLLAAIETHIENLSSQSIFRLVGLLARYLTPPEAFGILDRHTSAMLTLLEPDDRVVPGFDTLQGPEETAARYPRETQEMVFDAHARGFA
ncbi:hypothetical protein, partial [uncultured Sphingomonas sp.]|uniref:hypothetical protein n=1 Tax=uncultured Sphingomonas sp. TaxID=158754 RepID=UPI0035C98DFC